MHNRCISRLGERVLAIRDGCIDRYYVPIQDWIGFLVKTGTPEEVVDLLFATLVGAMIPRVLRFPDWSADGFRTALLRQIAEMLGRPGYQ